MLKGSIWSVERTWKILWIDEDTYFVVRPLRNTFVFLTAFSDRIIIDCLKSKRQNIIGSSENSELE